MYRTSTTFLHEKSLSKNAAIAMIVIPCLFSARRMHQAAMKHGELAESRNVVFPCRRGFLLRGMDTHGVLVHFMCLITSHWLMCQFCVM